MIRITFKLACLTYKLLTTSQPAYLCSACYYTTTPLDALYGRLIQFFLDMPRFSTEVRTRSFSYLAPTVWNGQPRNIRLSTHFRHLQTPSEDSPFQIAHQHPYHAAHLVTRDVQNRFFNLGSVSVQFFEKLGFGYE